MPFFRKKSNFTEREPPQAPVSSPSPNKILKGLRKRHESGDDDAGLQTSSTTSEVSSSENNDLDPFRISPLKLLDELSFSPGNMAMTTYEDSDDEDRWSNELSHASRSPTQDSPSLSKERTSSLNLWSPSSPEFQQHDDYQATSGIVDMTPEQLSSEFADNTTTTLAGISVSESRTTALPLHYEGRIVCFDDLPKNVKNALKPIMRDHPNNYNMGLRFAIGKASPPNPVNLANELFTKHLIWRATEVSEMKSIFSFLQTLQTFLQTLQTARRLLTRQLNLIFTGYNCPAPLLYHFCLR